MRSPRVLALGVLLLTAGLAQAQSEPLGRYRSGDDYDWQRIANSQVVQRLSGMDLLVARDRAMEALRAGQSEQTVRGLIREIDLRRAEEDQRAGNLWWDRLAGFRDPLTAEVDYTRVLKGGLLRTITSWQGAEVVLSPAVKELDRATADLANEGASPERLTRIRQAATTLEALLSGTGTLWKDFHWLEADVSESLDRVRRRVDTEDPARQALESTRNTILGGLPDRPRLVQEPEAVNLSEVQGTAYDWARLARYGVRVETQAQATAMLTAGLEELELQARRAGRDREALGKLRTVTEALHELRYAIREHGWRFEWVELTWEPALKGARERLQPFADDGRAPFVEQLSRLTGIGNELAGWISDARVQDAFRAVTGRAGPKAARLTTEVHPGLVGSATYFPKGERFGEAKPQEVTFAQRFVNEVYFRSRQLPRAQRTLFQQQVFALIAARVAVYVEGKGDVEQLVREATGAEVLPAARELGTGAELEVDRAGSISADGTTLLAEDPARRAQRLAWEQRVNKAIRELHQAYADTDRARRLRLWAGENAKQLGSAYGKFLMAIFLKELATGLAQGDASRVKELYSVMGMVGLFKEYGLFMAGAAGGELLYKRALERRVFSRTSAVGGVVRSSLALATGLALPQLVRGHFDGKAYAISLASLGFSAAAVEGVMGLIPGVRRLKTASRLAGASRALRLGGWVYQGVELALVLTVGDAVESWITEADAKRRARNRLEQSASALWQASDAELPAALESYQEAWDGWRNLLLLPALEARQEFQERLARVSRQAQLDADQAARAQQLAQKFEGLPLGDFAKKLGAKDDAAQAFTSAGQRFQSQLDEAFHEAYELGHRRQPFLPVMRGARQDDPDDLATFREAHRSPSQNRIQSYLDQREALEVIARLHGQSDAVAQAQAQLQLLEQLDRALMAGGTLTGVKLKDGPGATDLLRDSLQGE